LRLAQAAEVPNVYVWRGDGGPPRPLVASQRVLPTPMAAEGTTGSVRLSEVQNRVLRGILGIKGL